MFGQSTSTGRTALSDNGSRMYRIEVEAMGQNVDPDTISYRIRSTRKTYITVPYNRMSEQLKRINRMGGKILSIEPLTVDGSSEAKMQATAVNQILDGEGKPKSVGADDSDTQE
ncbi:phycobilisome 8.9 kDa linker polypeptide, phycocyanin-associated, rod domain protein [Lyngbya aestuarii BL J]|uniref:Phycobilisome 8.9 kDa linker polypeptide, phycocyanin-associated, rod domain protein n=1 Tax=Lyngbya aestuarii BL J TaxID=1348334 RepID=U7QGL7_9CYAN|nr:phycobilisome linker polypeptide [Lyngbya aestuarii]ERT07033.1 phycobilisome 8.9 kDa linker polypeptide, phycocyanin-associated, rod domain protein [Lyngbya aestuarii BL J]